MSNTDHKARCCRIFGRHPLFRQTLRKVDAISKWPIVLGVLTHRGRKYGRHFADGIVIHICLNKNCPFSIKISLNIFPLDPIDNKSALVQIMAWRRPGAKPLSEPMIAYFTDAYMHHTNPNESRHIIPQITERLRNTFLENWTSRAALFTWRVFNFTFQNQPREVFCCDWPRQWRQAL